MQVYRNNNNADSPISGPDYTMWAEDRSSVQHYGRIGWTADVADLPHISSLADAIMQAWDQDSDDGQLPPELAEMGRGVLDDINPDSIVDSAGVWDCVDFVVWVYGRVFDAVGIEGVRLSDGAILFDQARAVRAELEG